MLKDNSNKIEIRLDFDESVASITEQTLEKLY